MQSLERPWIRAGGVHSPKIARSLGIAPTRAMEVVERRTSAGRVDTGSPIWSHKLFRRFRRGKLVAGLGTWIRWLKRWWSLDGIGRVGCGRRTITSSSRRRGREGRREACSTTLSGPSDVVEILVHGRGVHRRGRSGERWGAARLLHLAAINSEGAPGVHGWRHGRR